MTTQPGPYGRAPSSVRPARSISASAFGLFVALARLGVAPKAYQRLADAVPLVGRDALRHADLATTSPQWSCWASKLRYAYTYAYTRYWDLHTTTLWTLYQGTHRDFDLPACVNNRWGYQEWFRNGVQHRDGDEPAIVWTSGDKWWMRDGKMHRDGDRPARLDSNGTTSWFRNGRLHRDGDKPAVEYADGTKEWWRNGERHRDDDGPAVDRTDNATIRQRGGHVQEWYRHGKRHRDGNQPAIIDIDGSRQWYQDGRCAGAATAATAARMDRSNYRRRR